LGLLEKPNSPRGSASMYSPISIYARFSFDCVADVHISSPWPDWAKSSWAKIRGLV